MKTTCLQLIAVIALFMSAMFNLSARPSGDDTQEALKSTVAEITRNCHNDYEKAYAIYQWIIQHVEYDETIITKMEEDIQFKVVFASLTADREVSKEELRWLYSHYVVETYSDKLNQGVTVFETHKGICSSIAHLYKLMCEEAGLKCKIVIGLSVGRKTCGGHAWNIVLIDGKKHLVDVTQGISALKIFADMGISLTADILEVLGRYFDMDPYRMLANGYFPIHAEDQCLPYELSYKDCSRIAYTSPIKRHHLLKSLELSNAYYGDIECDF